MKKRTRTQVYIIVCFGLCLAFGLAGSASKALAQNSSTTDPSARATTQPPVRRARISGGVMAGNILTRVAPQYPADARDQHISGTVVMHAIIGKDGLVKDLQVVSGTPILAEAAVAAVQQWTYKPYLLNGEPTEVDTTITVNFNLGPPPVR